VARAHYDRLSATDLVFLELEEERLPMHIGAVSIFEPAGLVTRDGALDMERISAFIGRAVSSNPRFRQRLAYVPLLAHPVWIDDECFHLAYHLHHARLPAPGDERALRRLTGRLMSQRLDRGKPLWEMWFVEGLAESRIALISKFHHCMIDGISGVDVLAALLRLDPSTDLPAHKRWRPRPAPTGARLLADELRRRAVLPLAALGHAPQLFLHPCQSLSLARDAFADFIDAARANMTVASNTPLNSLVGPHRSFEWTSFDLGEVKDIRNRLGGTINDVVLTVVAGSIGQYLRHHGIDTTDLDIRMTMPVNLRSQAHRGTLGNRVGVLTISLPVAERDPHRRLQSIIETTDRLKHSGQLHGVELVAELSDRVFPPLAAWMASLASRRRMYNLSVTNIPGPQMPVYLLDARMIALYPLAFLFSNQALTIGIFSYLGRLFWTLTLDDDALPDAHIILSATEKEFERLHASARLGKPRPKKRAKTAGRSTRGNRGGRKAR
jgi:diacylglycerol O-acyltransferase